AWLHIAFTAATFAAPVCGFSPWDRARVVPKLSITLGQFGSVETNRLAASVTDTWSVSTHAPGGTIWSIAAGIGPMTFGAPLSKRNWKAATAASTTADTAKTAVPAWRAPLALPVRGQVTAR